MPANNRLPPRSEKHPLTAVRRVATVASVSNQPYSIAINFAGDTTNVNVPYLDSYHPTVGDRVLMISVGGDHIVVGAINTNTGTDRRSYYRMASYSAFPIPSGSATTITSFTTILEHSEYIGVSSWSSGTFTVPGTGAYDIHFQTTNGGTASSRCDLDINSVNYGTWIGENKSTANTATPISTSVTSFWLVANDAITFKIFQNQGTTQNYDGYVAVRRVTDDTGNNL